MTNSSQITPDIPVATDPAREMELFRRSPMRQTQLAELRTLIRSINAKKCLEITMTGGATSYYLRKHAGDWHTQVVSPKTVDITRALVSDNVGLLSAEQRLPFEDKHLDLIVLVDILETLANPTPLLDECHRVLCPSGHIALTAPYAGRLTPLRSLRRALERRTPVSAGVRREFREADLFELLKTGFDVIKTRSYAHFFSELINIFLQKSVRGIPADTPDAFERRIKRHRIAHPFFRIAFQLDTLLYPLRGNQLVALARRHSWRPRNSPVLQKAESITGAVLSTVR